ncbi:copper chaperone PCu(A)C [Tropicimonas sp.]|uniref:copper chaperone PCu(A)C n=1 Tax=Tropicimonas sp. TaxID=2067044 RepID=UPI003A89A084
MRLAAFSLALALMPPGALADDDHADHLSELGGIRAIHAWTRATSQDDALVFVEIENTGDETVTLQGGQAEIATGGELVGFRLKNGNESHVALPGIPVAPKTTLILAPGAAAIRLSGLTRPLRQGEAFEAGLDFDIGTLAVHVETEAADADRHSHAGHGH